MKQVYAFSYKIIILIDRKKIKLETLIFDALNKGSNLLFYNKSYKNQDSYRSAYCAYILDYILMYLN